MNEIIKINKGMFGRILKDRRMTQKEIAEKMSMNEATFSRKLNNKVDADGYILSFSKSELDALCKILDVSTDALEEDISLNYYFYELGELNRKLKHKALTEKEEYFLRYVIYEDFAAGVDLESLLGAVLRRVFPPDPIDVVTEHEKDRLYREVMYALIKNYARIDDRLERKGYRRKQDK